MKHSRLLKMLAATLSIALAIGIGLHHVSRSQPDTREIRSRIYPNSPICSRERHALVEEFYSAEHNKMDTLERLRIKPRTTSMQYRQFEVTEESPYSHRQTITIPEDSAIRSLEITNTGPEPIQSVYIKISDEPYPILPIVHLDFFTHVALEQMSDEQIATDLFYLVRDYNVHYSYKVGSADNHDPIRYFNVYGYGVCDDAARVLAQLATHCGLNTRIVSLKRNTTLLGGHRICEMFYGGQWHMYDADRGFFLLKNGEVANIWDIKDNPQIIKDTFAPHTKEPWGRGVDLDTLTTFFNEASVGMRGARITRHSLEYTLDEGESIRLSNIPEGEPYIPTEEKGVPPRYYANGKVIRRLSFRGSEQNRGSIRCPFVITDIRPLLGSQRGYVDVTFVDGSGWIPLANRPSLERALRSSPRYYYEVRYRGESPPEELWIDTTFNCSPFILGRDPFAKARERTWLPYILGVNANYRIDVEVGIERRE